MPELLVNIDVPDLERAVRFYTSAFDLHVRRRFDAGFVELGGAAVPIYLLSKADGTRIGPTGGDHRCYERHWTPVHLDIVVTDLDAAIARAVAAGAVQESEVEDAPYGRLAMFADIFGHGFCLIAFNADGYDALTSPGSASMS